MNDTSIINPTGPTGGNSRDMGEKLRLIRHECTKTIYGDNLFASCLNKILK